ncbi:hypothetical protein TKK_0013559 [Trichogramma kaykai]|uniref:Phosphoenolpyruvate synthase n=1 Tax=Trichogramma kaykai TaxID=54128 RepID=A0ABD2WHY8_9HYME
MEPSIDWFENYLDKFQALKIKFSGEPKTLCYHGADQLGNSFYVKFKRTEEKEPELVLILYIDGGSTKYELPQHPNTVIKRDKDSWSADGLTMTVLEEDKRVRITFNGLLRKGTRKSVDEDINTGLEHVRLNFIFVASTQPFPTHGGKRKSLYGFTEIDQYGSMMGLVRLERRSRELFLRGMRQLYVGEIKFAPPRLTLMGADQIGNIFCIHVDSENSESQIKKFGHIKDPLDNYQIIDSSDLTFEDFMYSVKHKHDYSSSFKTDQTYEVKISWRKGMTYGVYGGYPWNHKTRYLHFTMELNGTKGFAIAEYTKPYVGPCPINIPITDLSGRRNRLFPKLENFHAYLLPLSSTECQDERLVGGRGASLAQMKSLKMPQFIVADGFCLTTEAFTYFLNHNKELSAAVQKLKRDYNPGFHPTRPLDYDPEKEIKFKKTEALDKIAELFKKAKMPDQMKQAIDDYFHNNIGSQYHTCLCEVHCSAYHEDADEKMWGGLDEWLCDVSSEEVYQAVIDLWASLYKPYYVDYRASNGLPLDRPIGVVVQKQLGEPDAFGVLFTRHPRTGDPRKIYAGSHSGAHKPDNYHFSIRVAVDRHNEFKLEDNGPIYLDGDSSNIERRNQVRIGNKVALRLAEIGRELDELYGSARFIDWSYYAKADRIYLHYCRPLTHFEAWTDFELTHELGTGVPADKDMLTSVHAAEIFPYCVTPLTRTVVCEALAPASYYREFRSVDVDDDFYIHKNAFVIFNNRVFFNYFNLAFRSRWATTDKSIVARDFARGGQSIVAPEVLEDAKRRIHATDGAIVDNLKHLGGIWLDYRGSKGVEIDFIKLLLIPHRSARDGDEDDEMKRLNGKMCALRDASRTHGHFMRRSERRLVRLLDRLARGKDITDQTLADTSIVLGYPTELPSNYLPTMMNMILNSKYYNRERLLINHKSFIRDYRDAWGFLGFNELEMASEPFGVRPDAIFRMLTKIKRVKKPVVLKPSEAEFMKELRKFPEAHVRAVADLVPGVIKSLRLREESRVCLSKAVQILRMYFCQMADELVKAGKLPDVGLIHYLTREEALSLAKPEAVPMPDLIRKAHRRRELWFELDRMIYYPEYWYGIPRPIDRDGRFFRSWLEREEIYGTPIFPGEVRRGVLIVARTPEEAHCLMTDFTVHPSVILVTPCIDAGWSQFLPFVGGVITEYGGILSEGALIVRESSLPCIMGVPMATKIFRTGDPVYMDGYNGEIKRLKRDVETQRQASVPRSPGDEPQIEASVPRSPDNEPQREASVPRSPDNEPQREASVPISPEDDPDKIVRFNEIVKVK